MPYRQAYEQKTSKDNNLAYFKTKFILLCHFDNLIW